MSARAAAVTQTEIARALRAARQEGASAVRVLPDGSILIHLSTIPAVDDPDTALDPFDTWKREHEARNASTRPRKRV